LPEKKKLTMEGASEDSTKQLVNPTHQLLFGNEY
jgi:hypothetical protein